MPANEKQGVVYNEPTTDDEREEVASACVLNLELALPTLIDGMDNAAATAYASVPERIFIIGKDGKIAYAGDRGPRGFSLDELSAELAEMSGE